VLLLEVDAAVILDNEMSLLTVLVACTAALVELILKRMQHAKKSTQDVFNSDDSG